MNLDINFLIDELATNAGDLWFVALLGSFFVMICEAAKPKPAPGESRAGPEGFALLVAILSLVTPLMLFLHAFLTASGALLAIIAVIGGAILVSAVVGWVIRASAPGIGATLNRAAPVLAVAVFALTLYVTGETLFKFVNSLITAGAA